ncbi:DNA internalization-related competence protein ComEC/Rec2 [Brevibacillus agri]|uniref:DNA internalization-related competence protein ComEC/Rec2 n=1 Tax=Brevibacillus agri TaxID=51101 RepID=UPI002E1A9335|nr:DNA internalization-related competence protein ComEC/Rec2 [Brevibacillus agri]MED1825472.1 DNA internalization-related competence protein ComEC/Rec2 [Brevibacillus agri]
MSLWNASLAVMSGLLLSAYAHPVWLLGAAGAWAAAAAFVPRAYRGRLAVYSFLSILAGLYFYGYEILQQSEMKPLAAQERTVWVRGEIASGVKRDGDVARFFADVGQWREEGESWQQLGLNETIVLRVKLSAAEEAAAVEKWRTGSELVALARLGLPQGARNPHAFDYARYLHWQGVHVVAETAFRDARVEAAASIQGSFQEWQKAGAERIESLFADRETAGYMKSLLLGLGQDVTPELESMYANLGLSHVLAISGLHVTLVTSMFMWCLDRLGVSRRWGLFATVSLLVGYVLLVGASASAVRSGLMGGVGLVCQVAGKRLDGKEVWAGALLVMLAVNPYQLWHVGFQLSFAVTLGLILFVPYSLHVFERVPVWIRTLVAVTFSAQLVSFPFLIYHFHQFSPLSWLVNLLATPVLSLLVLPLGYIAIVLALVHPALAAVPVWLTTRLLGWIHEPLYALDQQVIPFTYWPHPKWWWLLLYACFLGMLPILWNRGYHRKQDVALCLALFLGLLVAARQPLAGSDEVRITFLDVGQGDSIVVEIGTGKVYLMDAGGTMRHPAAEPWMEKRDPFEVGKDVVLPFLMARGIEKIDRAIMTHGDLDHIGGMEALVPRFSFGEVLVNGQVPEAKEAQIRELFHERGVPITTGTPGQVWSDGPEIEWKWLHPGETTLRGNDASVVLQLTAYNKTVLFTGDIERSGEAVLVQNGLSPVDVLKVAHHGSNTSSTEELLAATAPKAAVISAGVNNRYGHPAVQVLQRLGKYGTTIYRTDRHGAITLIISPAGLSWNTQQLDT